MQFKVGNVLFPSKRAAAIHTRSLVGRYKSGAQIEGDDLDFILALIQHHRESVAKIGVGIKSVTVEVCPPYYTPHLRLWRVDGSSTDCSWVECINPSKAKDDVSEALRVAIRDQIKEFRLRRLASRPFCDLTGKPLFNDLDTHVDHVAPNTFEKLARVFVESQDGFGGIKISPPLDNQYQTEMTDPKQREAWIVFHKEKAELRLVSRQAHLRLSRRKSSI